MELLLILLALPVILIGGLLVLPSPIEPIAWTPGEAFPATGIFAQNNELRQSELIGEGRLRNPEDVAFDAQGRLYAGSRDMPNLAAEQAGVADVNPRIERVTFNPDGTHRVEEFVKLPGGGPLDMRFDAQGNLIVASWGQGLISISPERQVKVLVPEGRSVDGIKFEKPDGIAIHSDGRIFFTQGTSVPASFELVWQVLEGKGYGRLLEYTPATGAVRVLVPDLSFGNGVALAPDESYVLVADQYRYRIKRYWLTGPNAGREDIFTDRLPGFVHNLYLDDQNVLWVALYMGRSAIADSLAGNPFLKQQLAKLPTSLFNNPTIDRNEALRGDGSVLAMDLKGNPLLSLQNPPRQLHTLSTAVYHQGFVYMGTITGGPVIRYKLKQRPLPLP
jgi:sugar lactone lactonase YvrE